MTDGVTCAATEYGPYGVCGGFTSTCDETGTQSRTVTTYACAAEACSAATGSESGACVRDTDGTACTRGGAFPCHATRCVSGGCNIVGDSCGTGICCEFGCQPMGTVCP
jgi:hypothetical protein